MPRRSGEETRRLLIATGVALLLERGVSVGVSHIRLQEVVKRAGLTTGAAYRLWGNQEDFHRELAVAAVRHRAEDPLRRTREAIGHLVESGAPVSEVIRVAAAARIDEFDDEDDGHPSLSDRFLTMLALRAGSRGDDELQVASRERHAASIDAFVELYSALMAIYDMQMRPPFTVRDFAVALAALSEGFAIQAIEGEKHSVLRLTTANGTGGAASEWTLFGVAVFSLVNTMLTPFDPGAALGPCPATGDK